MLTIEAKDHNESGIANLEDAVNLARVQGISVAKNALSADLIYAYHSLGAMVACGFTADIPGFRETSQMEGVEVSRVVASELPSPINNLLTAVEQKVVEATEDTLPGWRPTQSLLGVRMVAMKNDAEFSPHTDDYEGLVAAVQVAADGEKMLVAVVDDEIYSVETEPGDIVFFGGDTFSENPRIMHGFGLSGSYAVSFTLGQDPTYTISGRLPLLQENPAYAVEIQRILSEG